MGISLSLKIPSNGDTNKLERKMKIYTITAYPTGLGQIMFNKNP